MDERAAWDRFWSYDRLASFGTGVGAGNYRGTIADGWKAFFQALPARARVLDLCSGNGAIAVLAVEAGDELQVTGADLAAVAPASFVSASKAQLQRVRFLPGTPAESLPLDDCSVDAVASQYGIEYSDLERSVPEAARVLAPDGRLRFACHAAEGSVVADTRQAIGDADFLIDQTRLFDLASRAFAAILGVERGRDRGPFAQTAAQSHYAAFRSALAAVVGRTKTGVDQEMLVSVHRSLTALFQQRAGRDEGEIEAGIAALRAEVEAHRQRQRALLAAARSREQMAALGDQLRGLGLGDIRHSDQREAGALVGHVIEATRR